MSLLTGTVMSLSCASATDDGGGGFSTTQGAAQARPPSTTDDAGEAEPIPCAEDNARFIQGFRLGQNCAGDSETLAGMCAVATSGDELTGRGEQLCFVSPEGGFFLAFVHYGEGIEGTSFRYGMGTRWPDQLAESEADACRDRTALLATHDTPEGSVSGERFYMPCE